MDATELYEALVDAKFVEDKPFCCLTTFETRVFDNIIEEIDREVAIVSDEVLELKSRCEKFARKTIPDIFADSEDVEVILRVDDDGDFIAEVIETLESGLRKVHLESRYGSTTKDALTNLMAGLEHQQKIREEEKARAARKAKG